MLFPNIFSASQLKKSLEHLLPPLFLSIRLLLYNHMCFWDNRKTKKQNYHNTFSITLTLRRIQQQNKQTNFGVNKPKSL